SGRDATYTLSLHDALPICARPDEALQGRARRALPLPAARPRALGLVALDALGRARAGALPRLPRGARLRRAAPELRAPRRVLERSEEHTSELQSRENLVCR